MAPRFLVAFVVLAGSVVPAVGQDKSVSPGINDRFQKPDVKAFLQKFEVESREIYGKRQDIVTACAIKPGMAVADIGAGTGLFTRLFAGQVGPKGRVYAVDIARSFLDHIEKTCREGGLKNVVGVVCDQKSVGLPAQSIDLAFICDTYHHFEFPYRTMTSLHAALRPGGRVVLIDFQRIPGKSSDWVLSHVRAGQEVFTKEILEAGFRKVEEQGFEEQGFLKENYFVVFAKVEKPTAKVSEATKDEHGFLVHAVQSEFQAGTTHIRVLLPDRMDDAKKYQVVYLLPVEAGMESRYGDGLLEVKKLDLHNKLGVIFVQPTFSHLPWYADHPSKRDMRQETYLLQVVVPFIEGRYPLVGGAAGRLLVGFSKSGWGAFSLLLRHPHFFGRAAAWDAPLDMARPDRFGMADIFGNQENFEKYRITKLLEQRAAELQKEKRLALVGYANFKEHHHAIREQLMRLKISHEYRDTRLTRHTWDAGWLEGAVRFVASKN